LDLSHNQLHNVSMNVFLHLGNLYFLSLASNPLHSLQSDATNHRQRSLKILDLSDTRFETFVSTSLQRFATIQTINFSQSSVNVIDAEGSHHVPSLVDLHLQGCPMESFPEDKFRGLTKLRSIWADTYKLCCSKILPGNFDERSCHAPENEVASCDDLLRSETYRGFLWLMGALSLSGNAFCLVFRSVLHKGGTKAFNVFVSSLCLADFSMGVYVIIIGAADLVYRGTYLHNDIVWTRSVACQVAGFLCMLSNEVSALTILLITVDRFVVLRFPFSGLRFGRVSASVACLSSWVVGFSLALVPLLPATAHWQFYSQTGICIPLPITRQDFEGRRYAIGVMIVFNFALFLIIAGGQAVIYWSVQVNSMASYTGSRKSKDRTDSSLWPFRTSCAGFPSACAPCWPLEICPSLAR
jgi:hypothetical protein